MKKAVYIFFISFISNFFYGQSGQVVYAVKMDSTSYQESGQYFERLKKMKEYANNQKFELKFNNNLSSFKYMEGLHSDSDFSDRENTTAQFAMTTSSDFYYNKVENIEIQQKKDGQLIEKEYSKVSWILGTESKKIDSYLCYKATYKEPYIARKSGETRYREVVAWYAPSLPYSFGPINFYGLPGLILELKYKNATYFATNIALKGTDIFIDFPKGKTVTKEEYEKKLKAQMGM
jgi:GLPGLI family protein